MLVHGYTSMYLAKRLLILSHALPPGVKGEKGEKHVLLEEIYTCTIEDQA